MSRTMNLGQRFRHRAGSAMGRLGFCTSWAINRQGRAPEWLQVERHELPIRNLPEPWIGRRVVHLSDFHLSRTVSRAFLARCIDRVNGIEPDLILLTGDYITVDPFGRYRQLVLDLIGRLQARLGVYACLGNHDYGLTGPGSGRRSFRLREITNGLRKRGVVVLRNTARTVRIDDQPLWLVGLGDLWANDLRPDRGFARVPCDQPVIVLVHNPRAAQYLGAWPHAAVVCGHTHGRRIKWTGVGTQRRIGHRRYHAGLYALNGGHMYVNRGLGRLGSLGFNARPEIAVLTLTKASVEEPRTAAG